MHPLRREQSAQQWLNKSPLRRCEQHSIRTNAGTHQGLQPLLTPEFRVVIMSRSVIVRRFNMAAPGNLFEGVEGGHHWTFLLRFFTPAPTQDRKIVWLSRSGRTLQCQGGANGEYSEA